MTTDIASPSYALFYTSNNKKARALLASLQKARISRKKYAPNKLCRIDKKKK